MKKETTNKILCDFVHNNLTPKQGQRDYITKKFESLKGLLKQLDGQEPFRSGSLPRYTALDPVEDLDVIWPLPEDLLRKYGKERNAIKGKVDPYELDVSDILADLATKLKREYDKIGGKVEIEAQSHSVCITFVDSPAPFSIDLVPGISTGLFSSDFSDEILRVPETAEMNKSSRIQKYTEIQEGKTKMKWILSDPKGYIRASQELNDINENYRRTAKLAKAWKRKLKNLDDTFPLKSFHLELVVFQLFAKNQQMDCLTGITLFFEVLEDHLHTPCIPDRANQSVMIDQYIEDIDEEMRAVINREIGKGQLIFSEIAKIDNEEEILKKLDELFGKEDKPTFVVVKPVTKEVKPSGIWGE